MTSKGTDRRTIRVDPDLWDEFGEWAKGFPGGASGALRACMRFLLGKPEAKLPTRPDGSEPAAGVGDEESA